jgi:hypothetical protein
MFQMHRVDLMTDTLIPDSAKRSLQVQGLPNGATIPRSTPVSHLNTSTPQHLNTSTPQHLNTSTPQHLNTTDSPISPITT